MTRPGPTRLWAEVSATPSGARSTFFPNARVLDLGCGTGEDALHLLASGAVVTAIDSSSAMVEIARSKGVDARLLSIEHLDELSETYDFVLSNFGALNCVADFAALRESLARRIHPGGVLALCVMNRFCMWELLYYAVRGQFGRASRRWSGKARVSELSVFYPSLRQIESALSPAFRLTGDAGIGVCVPPSYVRALPPWLLKRFERLDSLVAGSRIGRAIGDHRLFIFVR